jgi:crotonobetaine/carnitine-CoA ligase
MDSHTGPAVIDHDALDRNLVFPRLIERRSREDGDRTFIQTVDGPAVSYREAHERGLRWAAGLQHVGVGTKDTVATMLPVADESVLVWLGVSWLGAWEVPLNTEYQGRMLSHALNDSRARTAVVASRYLPQLLAVLPELTSLQQIVVIDAPEVEAVAGIALHSGAAVLGAEPCESLPGPEPWDIACVVYTSGTTGPSKGVLMPWAQMLVSVYNPHFEQLGSEDHWYSPFPMFHLSGKGSVYGAALRGAQVVLRERFSVTAFWEDVARYRCGFTWFIGSMQGMLFAQPEDPRDAQTPLRYAFMVPVIPEYKEFAKRFDVRLSTLYNMTELSMPIISSWDMPNYRSCGRPRPGYQVRVVDEHDVPVGPGEFGEFIVRSDTPWTMNVGYLNQPEQTAVAWRHGWFHTGDGGTYDEDGNFYFGDRIKDAIRRRGENISSMEVEIEVLAHQDVAECAAIGVPSAIGEEDVAVLVVPRAGATVDPAKLLDFLTPRMPKFMLPRYVRVVESLPRTVTQKVRKAELRSMFDAAVGTWDREANR